MVVLMSKSIPGHKNEYSANISLKAIPGSSQSITKKKNTISIFLNVVRHSHKVIKIERKIPFISFLLHLLIYQQ